MSIFHYKINGGAEQTIETKTGLYHLAAAAAFAQYENPDEDCEDDDIMEIWVPDLLPEYGPYFYVHDGYQVGERARP